MRKRVAVGLSGGIDSSFAAYLLKKEGWEVFGFTLKFYPEENRCCDVESLYQAKKLCHRLDIPHYVLDVKDLFRREIVDYFINSYLKGLTPNPCAFCNRLIKFGFFLQKIRCLGIDYLATGHYVRLEKKGGSFFLRMARDKKKSQEYFLSLVKPAVLPCLVFPLADYTKKEVKQKAGQENIIFKPRRESFDACFVREKHYAEFIDKSAFLNKDCQGYIKHIRGDILGRHKGIHYFTYGQREGIGVGGRNPLYVIDIESRTNTVIVGEKEYLYRDSFAVHSCNWFLSPDNYSDIKVKIRYGSPLYRGTVKVKDTDVYVQLKDKIEGIAPGQICSFYRKDILLGGGIIAKEPA